MLRPSLINFSETSHRSVCISSSTHWDSDTHSLIRNVGVVTEWGGLCYAPPCSGAASDRSHLLEAACNTTKGSRAASRCNQPGIVHQPKRIKHPADQLFPRKQPRAESSQFYTVLPTQSCPAKNTATMSSIAEMEEERKQFQEQVRQFIPIA